MALTSVEIVGMGGISKLTLTLDPHLNILCGPNGVGKTSVLESIASAFHFGPLSRIKRHALCSTGTIKLGGEVDGRALKGITNLTNFLPDASDTIQGNYQLSHWVLYLGTSRDIAYSKLVSIQSDPTMDDSRNHSRSHALVRLNDVKNWFIQRFLYSKHDDSLAPELIDNFKHATEALGDLQDGFKFHNVDAKRSEIMIGTPTGVIPFEYLSSGFRSCIALLFGIIKEIEHRFPPEQAKAANFSGIIMIDEIELHLHPEWQRRICAFLLTAFPCAQFIITTHSPTLYRRLK